MARSGYPTAAPAGVSIGVVGVIAVLVAVVIFGDIGQDKPQPHVAPAPHPSNSQELVVEVGYYKKDRPVRISTSLIVNGGALKFQNTGGNTKMVRFVHRSSHSTPPQVTAAITRGSRTSGLKVWCSIQYAGRTVSENGTNEVTCLFP